MFAKRKDKKGRGLRTGESQRKLHPDQPLPEITHHVFRHIFCTPMALGHFSYTEFTPFGR